MFVNVTSQPPMLELHQRYPTMIPDVQNLIELQKIDREILRLKDEVAALRGEAVI